MLCSIRRLGYWILDALRGGHTRKNYKDIKCKLENGIIDGDKLNSLLIHATNTTEFYKDFDPSDISSFPVITKNDIKNSWDAFFSSQYKDATLHTVSTSGSTGVPFMLKWNGQKRKRQLADMIYFNEKAGHKIGLPYIYFRVWNDRNSKSPLEKWMQNLIPINIEHFNNDVLESARKRLKSRPWVNACIGYASTYEFLTKYMSNKGDIPSMFKTKVFITSSAVMPMEIKQLIKDTVGCAVVDRYSNEENGFLAQTKDTSDIFDVNFASFRMEILKQDSDESCEIGELGRIVITDLYNYAVPMIRYDTGDLAIKYEEKDGWTTKLKTVQGRRVDVIYDTFGNVLTTHTWGVHMKRFDKLLQYQFIQNSARSYTIKLNGAKPHYTDDEILSHLKSVLGDAADITIEHVDNIPNLKSGKFKSTVCNYEYNAADYEGK